MTAAKSPIDVIARSDRHRGELATTALESREDPGTALATALAADRANTLRFAIKPDPSPANMT